MNCQWVFIIKAFILWADLKNPETQFSYTVLGKNILSFPWVYCLTNIITCYVSFCLWFKMRYFTSNNWTHKWPFVRRVWCFFLLKTYLFPFSFIRRSRRNSRARSASSSYFTREIPPSTQSPRQCQLKNQKRSLGRWYKWMERKLQRTFPVNHRLRDRWKFSC